METYCQDRDLLRLEPTLFLAGGAPGQELTRHDGVDVSGTTLTCSSADFTESGIAPGMVVTLYTDHPGEGVGLEIISIDGPTQLTVSVLRPRTDLPAIPPQPCTDASLLVHTYQAQIQAVSSNLGEKLRTLAEAEGVDISDFGPSWQLTHAVTCGVLAEVFTSRAEQGQVDDTTWLKVRHYGDEFRRSLVQIRLTVDANGDGIAERTRSLGNVRLRRT